MMGALFSPLFSPLNKPLHEWRGQRVWLIGASSGIGAALAQALLARGAQVAVSARRAASLQEVVKLWPKAIVVPFDVQEKNAWQTAHTQLVGKFGGVDLVIFCAAKYKPERSWEVDAEDAADTLQVNLHSVYQGIAAVLPQMLQQKQGGIAIVASVAGYMGLPNASVYGPSKAALINLAELLYSDLHAKGMNVYLINPGFVQTELTAKNDFTMPALQTPEQAAQAIIQGFSRGDFEIHFPRRFTNVLKLVQMLPYRLRFALLTRFLKTHEQPTTPEKIKRVV